MSETKENKQPDQTIETKAYAPQYRIKPAFREAILKSIGDRPFNEIGPIMQAINVDVIDHNTLNQILQALGHFPYIKIAPVLTSIHTLVEQIIDED